jgi:hypothetical protein
MMYGVLKRWVLLDVSLGWSKHTSVTEKTTSIDIDLAVVQM